MNVISKHYDGTVFKTSEKGYSPKQAAKQLIRFLESQHAPFRVEYARTGSIYFNFDYKGVYFDLRISNHTKRIYDGIFYNAARKKALELCDTDAQIEQDEVSYQVLNTYTKQSLMTLIKSL